MHFGWNLLQVWQSHLSENERKYLMELLPSGPEPQQVLQALFTGDNFHFGNPFLKWQVFIHDISI